MHAIEAILGRPEVERLGWVLLHFVWQGVVGAGVLAGLLFAMRRASANARYLAGCATLAAMAACLPVTWLLLPQRSVAGHAHATAANVLPEMQSTAANLPTISAEHIAADTPALASTDAVVAPPRFDGPAAYQPVVASAQISWRERLAIGLPWFAAVWVVGVLVLSIRLSVGWTTVHRLRRAASRTIDDDKQMAMFRLARQLGIRWPVKLLESALVEVPTMIGWLRPAILWPPCMLTGLSVDQFESLLAHELAHIRRHDYLLNLIQTAIETLLFYHPAVWWVSSRIRHERECCCDDLAVAVCGNRLSYARALAVVEELRPRPRQFALAADGGRLLTRIRRIVGLPAPTSSGRHWLLGMSFSAALIVSASALVLSNFATGDEPPAKRAEAARPTSDASNKIDNRDTLEINVTGTLPEQPISGSYHVEPNGTVNLGATYGHVKVAGLTLNEATEAIYRKLTVYLRAPDVSVTLSRTGDTASANGNQGGSEKSSGQTSVFLTRVLSGRAVDAETGQPVQGFVYDVATFDDRDPARIHWNGEAIGPGSQKDGAFGIVVKNLIGRPVWARIIAPGYVPQPITEKPIILAEDSVLDKFEVRMHRGKTLSGRVVDSGGNPVADAGVYLLRNQGSRQVVRDPAAGAHQQFEMLTMTNARTDADGRFKMTGWDAESGRVAVMSAAMNLWVTPIPADASNWTIHLPTPAAIECLVDNDRGELSTLYDLDFITTGRKGWELLRAYQFNLNSKDGKLSITNHTPGQYELTRRRRVKVGDYEGEFKLADVKLQVDPSNTFTIDLRHPVGWPIAGQIAGLKELGLSGAVISVEPPGEVKRGQMTFDATTCGEDGRFETSRLAPGKYRVHVDAYLPVEKRGSAGAGGLNLPDTARPPEFTADVEVTIAKDQQPDNLKLELKKGGESRAFREIIQYHEQPHPAAVDEFTSSPWAVTATSDDPAKNGADASDNSKGGEKADPKPTTPKKNKPAETPMPDPKPIEVYGQVIDDETGKPVTSFDTQGGHVDEKDPTKVTWGYWLRPNAGGSEGRFDVNMDWNAGWRARVVASGYVPQPILTDPPKPGQDKIEGLVIRMKRGRTVHGRLVDHAGKPVKNAALFVVGSRPMDITGDQAVMNSSQGTVEDSSAGRYATDADGRFSLSGIGEDATNIAVSCRDVDLWIVPAPATDEASKDFEIRLPAPGKLIVQYDIPGGPDETTIFLQLHTWDREGWKGVDNRRRPSVKQHGELVLDNMTPGLYEVVRESSGFLDRRQVTIEPGKTVTSDFIRKAGAPITGRVVGLDSEDVQKAKPKRINISVHKPGEERNPIAPKFASVGVDPVDKNGKPSDGSFKTEIIPPGKYLVKVSVFIEETPEQRYRTGIIPPGFEGEATVTVPEQGAPPPVEIKLTKWQYKPFEIKKPADAPKEEAPKDSSKKAAGESPAARGSNRLSEPPADKGVDDAVKQGLQAIGNKQDGDEARKAAVTKGLLYLAQKQAKEAAAAEKAPNEVVTKVDPALVAELRALDAMRAGTSTALDKVDEAGRKLLEKYQKPEEQGLIYFILLQIHGDSGLQTPNRIISYAQQALKYPLGSGHKLRVYIYWGDTLNVQKTEKPLPDQRKEAAAVYLKGLKLAWMYPETPPAVPDPPPRYDGPEGPEQSARQTAWERYRDLRNKADFIKEVNSDRAIFIRQIADMYHRPPHAAATSVEIDALRKHAAEILQNDAAVARLMAAINPDPDAVHFGNAALPAFDINSKTTPADAVHVGNTALPANAPTEEAPNEDPKQTPPKESSKQEAYHSAFKRGLNSLAEPPADKVDDAVKQGLQAIGSKQAGDEATKAAVTKGLLYLARKQAEEATANERLLNEFKITVDLALAAELRALDAMRAGTSTPFDKVDEIGRKLLEKYQKPEEQGQIYYMLLQVHGQSGLVTPNHIITYAQQALKYPLGSRQEMMVYIYWGDTLNVQRMEKPLAERRKEAAAIYLKGLKLVWPYPETLPAVPDPPPLYDGPEGPEQAARQKAWEHYQDLRDKADFIKEVNYHRTIFIRQIADMYHRLPAATPVEVDALRKQANEILQNNAAVARLMAAVDPDSAKKAAAEPADSSLAKAAIKAMVVADAQDEPPLSEDEIEAAISKDPRMQQAMNELSQLMRQQSEIEKIINQRDDSTLIRVRDAIKTVRDSIEEIKKEDRQQVIEQAKRNASKHEENLWSKAIAGIEARLRFQQAREMNGTRIIATYLELRNVSDSATPIEISLDPSKIEFKVIDAKGKEVKQAGLPYDGMTALPGVLRLPHDSQLRLGVSGNGAGIPKDAGALLDLASSAVWLFKPGDPGEYRLQARFRIATKTGDQLSHETIEVPPARIPLGK